MEKRILKFQSIHRHFKTGEIVFSEWGPEGEGSFRSPSYIHGYQQIDLRQFTGKKCFNGKEVYEGDILFYEEQGDNGDERFYLVVTWIQEWCMFATIHLEEYQKYLSDGAKALDEVLYWTYPIEESDDYHYAGNIYQNPDLLPSNLAIDKNK